MQKSFDSLTHLDLFNNDICNSDEYRTKVFKLLPNLKYLDDADADDNDEAEEESDVDDVDEGEDGEPGDANGAEEEDDDDDDGKYPYHMGWVGLLQRERRRFSQFYDFQCGCTKTLLPMYLFCFVFNMIKLL